MYLTDPIDDSLFLRPTNDEELMNQIDHLKNKATLDVKVSLIKYVKQEIIDGLVIIVRKMNVCTLCWEIRPSLSGIFWPSS